MSNSTATALPFSFPTPIELKGTVQGTLLYLAVYFGFIIPFQAISKFYLLLKKRQEAQGKDGNPKVNFRAIKYYNITDTLALVGDRSVGQFVEYTIVFLPLLWLHALFVDPTKSWWICVWYSATRAIYPVVFSYNAYPGVLLSAFPNYATIYYLFWQLSFCPALRAATDNNDGGLK